MARRGFPFFPGEVRESATAVGDFIDPSFGDAYGDGCNEDDEEEHNGEDTGEWGPITGGGCGREVEGEIGEAFPSFPSPLFVSMEVEIFLVDK